MSTARDHFFKEDKIDNTEYPKQASYTWDFQSKAIIIFNDSLQTIEFSFNGVETAGKIYPSDKWISLDKKTETSIWIKTSKAVINKSAIRIMAWRGEV